MRFTSYAAASALAALASAQTWTDCNPMEKECPNDPAMPKNFETDFTAGKDAVKGWKMTYGSLDYTSEGAVFSVAKKGDAPTIGSETYLHFGYVEVKMKAAPGQGIISSIVLQSDNLDEVDWEWIGGVDNKVQMNYFGKGNTTTYDRMIEADVARTQEEFHTYALDWTAEKLTWIIDGTPVRTLKYSDANGGKNFPQTPCNVRLGNWPAGDSENAGTVSWAGGKVDYSKAPFNMVVASIKVINYSPGTEYHWKDKTGSYQSIEVIGAGDQDGADQNTVIIETSASATASEAPLESGFSAPTVTGSATASVTGSVIASVTGGFPHTGYINGTSTTCTDEQEATPAPTNPSEISATSASEGESTTCTDGEEGATPVPTSPSETSATSPAEGESTTCTDGEEGATPVPTSPSETSATSPAEGDSTTCTENEHEATPAPSNPGKTSATAGAGGSGFEFPAPTGGVSTPSDAANTPIASPSGGSSSGGDYGSGSGSDDEPCDCETGTATLTVTATGPSGNAPPATEVPTAPASSSVLGGVAPPASSATSPVEGGAGVPPANTPTGYGPSVPEATSPVEGGAAVPSANTPVEGGAATPSANSPVEGGAATPSADSPNGYGPSGPSATSPVEGGEAVPSATSPVEGGAAIPSAGSPVVSSAQPPAVVTSAVSPPPYATTGFATETATAPSMSYIPAPSGVLPAGSPTGSNATASSPAEFFTGAASANKVGALMAGAVAGVWLFAI